MRSIKELLEVEKLALEKYPDPEQWIERSVFITGYKEACKTLYTENEVLELLKAIQGQTGIDYNDEFMFAEEWFEQHKKNN